MRRIIKNKILSWFVTAMLVIGLLPAISMPASAAVNLWDGTIATAYAGGNGTQEDPYRIETGAQLAYLAQQVNSNAAANSSGKHFLLVNDIDLNKKTWTGIGTNTNRFQGTLDGGGNTVTGATSSLFSYIDTSGIVRRLGFINVTMNTTSAFNGVFAYYNSGTVDGCYTTGSITDIAASTCLGGFFYQNGTTGVLKNCYSTVTINGTATGNGMGAAGGLVGSNYGTILNCYATGTVTGRETYGIAIHVGGIAGTNSGSIINSYATGNLSVTSNYGTTGYLGGITGNNTGTITNGYWNNAALQQVNGSAQTKKAVGQGTNAVSSGNTAATQAFANTLNSNIATTTGAGKWIYTSDKNGGYPVFNTFTISYDANGGSLDIPAEQTCLDFVGGVPITGISPVRSEHDFLGWSTDSGAADALYAAGVMYTGASDITLYAIWKAYNYTVNLHGDGGSGTDLPGYTYGDGATLPTDWQKSGYTFVGWYDNVNYDGEPVTGITATDTGDKEYWAKWTLRKKVIEVTDDTESGSIAVTADTVNLETVFDRVVTQADTAGENVVTLSLHVSDITTQTSEVEAIQATADKGSEVYFFEVTLTKTVDDGVNTPQPTTLTNIPVPVEVHIKLTGDLAGKAYYKVYRYHNGVAEQISNDPAKTEHYKVDIENSEIVIYTMKFSTYAIFGNDISLQDLTNGEDMDVQAKITDASLGVYKVDIAWGAMTFEWNASGQEWNPDTHAYDPIPGNGVWTDTSHDGVNNRIVCANHSNGSLLATFDVSGTLGGVTYDVFTDNDVKDTAATDMSLPKVPNETATAPEIRAYLWLTGEPDGTAMAALNNIWQKVGVITITFTPDAGDTDKTPKN